MATETFTFEHTAAADVYVRLFNAAGQVFDFSDNTFKALAGATTPYKVATERADMAGTGRSGYTVAIDLATVNNTLAAGRYVLKAYDNATPADTDNPISDSLPVTVHAGELGDQTLKIEVFASVQSTAGDDADFAVVLKRNNRPVDITGATIAVVVRELGSDANLFTLTQADLLGATAIFGNMFRLTKATPNFTDDRQYVANVQITLGGVTIEEDSVEVVIG